MIHKKSSSQVDLATLSFINKIIMLVSEKVCYFYETPKIRILQIAEKLLTSFLKSHLGLQLGLENPASKTTFLSLPSLAYWSTSGFKNVSAF